MKKIFFTLFACATIGCVEVQNSKSQKSKEVSPSPEPVPVEVQSQVAPSESTEKPKVEFGLLGKGPHVYEVQFIPNGYAEVMKTVGGKSEFLKVNPEKWSDPDVVSGQKYTYQFGLITSSGFSSQQTIEVQIPTDMVIEGFVNFDQPAQAKSIKNINRLFLKSGSLLRINSLEVVISANEIHSDGGRIETFEKNKQVVYGTPARSGGSLTLIANSGVGVLHVDMRGESGGNGPNGAKFTELELSRFASRDLPQPDGHDYRNGPNGRPGLDGQNGANSGSVFVRIKDLTNLNVQVFHEPGFGGQGGRGGPGGEAPLLCANGPGYLFCPSNSVKLGKDGVAGSDGRPGQPGRSGQTCYQVGQQLSCR